MSNGAKKKPKGLLISGVILILLGVGGCVGAGAVTVTGLASIVDEISTTTAYGQIETFQADSNTGAAVLLSSAADCVGVDGEGSQVEFSRPSGTYEVDSGSSSFTEVLTFDTVEGQTYQVSCGLEGSSGEFTVLRLPSIFNGTTLALISGAGIGGVVFVLLGFVLMIVGLVQRSKWKKQQKLNPGGGGGVPGAPMPPPPGGTTLNGTPNMPPPPGSPLPSGPVTPSAPPAPAAPPPPAPPLPSGPGTPPPAPQSPPPAPAAPPQMPPPPPAAPPTPQAPPAPQSPPPAPPGPPQTPPPPPPAPPG